MHSKCQQSAKYLLFKHAAWNTHETMLIIVIAVGTSIKESAILKADEPPTASRPSFGLAKNRSFSSSAWIHLHLFYVKTKASLYRLPSSSYDNS